MSRPVRMGSLIVAAICLATPVFSQTQPAHATSKTTKKKPVPLPLPSGPLGPLPQFPLDSLPAVPPHVSFADGQLTIVTPNSTLGDVLRAVHSQTLADMDIPAGATDRVALHLGPGPAREVVATLLNGSRFNYVLLGAPDDPQKLIKVVLVAKVGNNEPGPPQADGSTPNQAANAAPPAPEDAEAADAQDDNGDAAEDQAAVDQPAVVPDPNAANGVKTPGQMLQEMQQRQLQLQQQQGMPPGAPIQTPRPQEQ